MSNFRDKFQVFFIGLLLGLLLGGGFFLFKLDQYVKELSIYKSFTHNTEHPSDKNETADLSAAGKNTSRYKPVPGSATAGQLQGKKDSLLAEGRSRKYQEADSLKSSDSVAAHAAAAASEEIVLRKDELLSTRLLEEFNISMLAANFSGSHDSLAAKMAGVRDEHAGSRQFSTVEFWSSPLNYKGYKMNRTKLVLYGLPETESVRLYKMDEDIYLHTGSMVYHLDYTNDFKPYERVTSDAILSKLK